MSEAHLVQYGVRPAPEHDGGPQVRGPLDEDVARRVADYPGRKLVRRRATFGPWEDVPTTPDAPVLRLSDLANALTPALRAQALREAATAMENDVGLTKGRITGTGYTYFTDWLRDEAQMWLDGNAPEQKAEREEPDWDDPATYENVPAEPGDPGPFIALHTASPTKGLMEQAGMSIGALREAIINATEFEGVFGQNVHESKDVLLRVGEKCYPLTEVSVGFYAPTGRIVMYLTGEQDD